MNRSTPGLPVHHQLPEFTQTHVILKRPELPKGSQGRVFKEKVSELGELQVVHSSLTG